MTIVVDASVLVAALTDQRTDGRWARETTAGGGLLVSSALVLSKVANTLRRLEQRGDLSREEAASAYRGLLAFDLDLRPFRPFAERVWELRRNLTSYDAWYVALAEALDCPLVTLDQRLSRSPGLACAVLTPPDGDA